MTQPKYRLLTKEELVQFEKEFIDYLVVNGITGEDWAKLKETNPDKAEQITNLFSDVVFEKILRSIQFLSYIGKKEIMTFQCLKDEIVLVGIRISKEHEGYEEIDFTNTEMREKYLVAPPKGVKVFTQTKKYNKIREMELFQMTENGALIDEGNLFRTLCLVL